MHRVIYLFFICLWVSPLSGEVFGRPWGRDAELTDQHRNHSECIEKPSALAELACYLIRFHREVISPADGPRSHFLPSSSMYTRDAMYKYGFYYGVMAGCDRLMRENSDPWIYPITRNEEGLIIKSDPVR